MAEKRSHVRYAVNGSIDLKTEEGVSYSFKTGVSNISFRGATILSREKIEIENKIVHFELMIELTKEPLIGKGKIKYILKEEDKGGQPIYKMGLEFIDINKNTILFFVNRLQEIRSSRLKKIQRVQKNGNDYFGPF